MQRASTYSRRPRKYYPAYWDPIENKENVDPETGQVSTQHAQTYSTRPLPKIEEQPEIVPTPTEGRRARSLLQIGW
jgi:hypothetical protein